MQPLWAGVLNFVKMQDAGDFELKVREDEFQPNSSLMPDKIVMLELRIPFMLGLG